MEPEWNPEIGSDQEITGVWTEGHDRLELSADGHYIYGTPPAIKTGTWTREGWNLYLKPGVFDQFENFTLMRFIEYHGHYRILTHPPDEPDELFFDHGLSKN